MQLADILERINGTSAGGGGRCAVIPGRAQDKLAVGFDNGRVVLMKGAHPTTHILKPLIDRIADSAYNELFCMRPEEAADVPHAAVHFVNDTLYYLVERYIKPPRRYSDTGTRRILCQASALPELKYEREGGQASPCANR